MKWFRGEHYEKNKPLAVYIRTASSIFSSCCLYALNRPLLVPDLLYLITFFLPQQPYSYEGKYHSKTYLDPVAPAHIIAHDKRLAGSRLGNHILYEIVVDSGNPAKPDFRFNQCFLRILRLYISKLSNNACRQITVPQALSGSICHSTAPRSQDAFLF